jgi:di/tricarboxylate transporter
MEWSALGWEAWATLGVVGLVVGLLVLTRMSPDLILLGGLGILLTAGILTPQEAFSGMANPGVITVAVMFGIAAALRETGVISILVRHLLGSPKSLTAAIVRIIAPVAVISAFLNNTPVVATLMPAVDDWAKQNRLSVSKLLIPLSYSAILGGMCTLIGTSTNLVVNGLLIQAGYPSLNMFDLTWVGVPCALVGLVYIVACGQWLLPNRRSAIALMGDPREYTVEMLVATGSSLVGKTIEQAGLRHLQGLYLMEIDRENQVLAAVSPQERLQVDDRLIFVGIIESVVDLQKIHGLTPATDQIFKLNHPRSERCLIEAVVSDTCPLAGKSIREGRFRTVYNAVVIAVSRNGERLNEKIGDITLRPGDTLLLETHPSFEVQQRNSRDFFLVSQVEDSNPIRQNRAWVAAGLMIGMVTVVTAGWLSILKAAIITAGLMVFTRCCSWSTVKHSVNLQVLLVIGASIGIGQAMQVSGMALVIAQSLIGLAGQRPRLVLAVVYGVTMLFTEMLTNTAAAVLVFPIAMATTGNLGVNLMPFIITIMIAASASFATPLGYQTNLMVYGPGGYRFSDYLRIGVPLDLLIWLMTVVITPRVWPF